MPVHSLLRFSQQVPVCILIGLYYWTIVSKSEAPTSDHKRGITYQTTHTIRQAKTSSVSSLFSKVKADAKIQDLKNTIRERTKNLTTHISHYCKTKLPGFKSAYVNPRKTPVTPANAKQQMYFDFTHSFLYCQTCKVILLA